MPFPGIPAAALAALDEPSPAVRTRLEEALRPLDPELAALPGLLEYGRLILAGNTVASLTGAKNWTDLVEAHVEDCLRAAALVPDRLRLLVDWGAGAGFPGLVWAIAQPRWTVFLIERNVKKAGFLREVCRHLNLPNARVHPRQLQEVLPGLYPRPDALVARAVEPLPALLGRLEGGSPLRQPLLWMAGPGWQADFDALPADRRAMWLVEVLGRYALAPGRGERMLVQFTRTEPPE
jgi:16S rRNA G527 N7-methylase RsmG